VARFIGQYEVLREMGAGHFGTVYAAVGLVPGRGLSAGKRRLVAIKQLHDDADPEQVELLQQEFALLDQVKHRCIVRVYEFLEEESAVVMEYVHGVTLRGILTECAKAREQVFTEAALEILIELADGLYQAWTTPGDNGEPLSLVHRDLKPANIMLTPRAEVKILDFGLARVDNAEFRIDDPDRIKGTPLYMAPEQARGELVDHRTDLFALGLVGYELFMGHPAYQIPKDSKDPVGDVFDAIEGGYLADQCAELESKVAGAGSSVTRLLQANPRDRYRTGHDLLVDLRRQLYRDRGSYIQEFCEFFFESLYRLEPAPDPSTAGSGAAAPRRGGSGRKRRTIEERLAESQAGRKSGNRGRSGGRPARGRDPEPTHGRKLAKAERFTPGSSPATPDRTSDSPKRKVAGARSAAETGMMELGSLSAILGADDEGNEPSATTFFSIATPKERATPAVPAAAAFSQPGIAPAPPIGVAPPMGGGAPSPPSAPAISGPSPGGIAGPTPGAISGPTTGGASGAGTNFSASPPPPPAASSDRTSSGRLYALILSIIAVVGVVIVAVMWLRPGAGDAGDAGANIATTPVAAAPAPSGDGKSGTEDTALPMPDPVPRSTRKSSSRKGSSKKSSSKKSSGTKSTPTSSTKSTAAGPLTVKLAEKGNYFSVEVTCGSGFRARGNLNNSGQATVQKVPQESCTMHLKGGSPASHSPVHGNMTVTCRFSGSTLICN
jgi:serine/threonine protein kinase